MLNISMKDNVLELNKMYSKYKHIPAANNRNVEWIELEGWWYRAWAHSSTIEDKVAPLIQYLSS